MAELPLATAQSSWQGDPERDFVNYRLIEVAHDALDEYFSDDDHLADYEKRMRGKRGKKNAAAFPRRTFWRLRRLLAPPDGAPLDWRSMRKSTGSYPSLAQRISARRLSRHP